MRAVKRIYINRKSVLFKIVVTYLLLIVLPFGAGIVFLTIDYENRIKAEWIHDSEQRMMAMQDNIRSIHLDLNSILVQIQQDTTFSPYRIRKNSYHTLLALNQLRRFSTTNELVHIVAYVKMNQDFVLTNISSANMEHFANRFFGLSDEEMSDFWAIIESCNNRAIAEPLAIIATAYTTGNMLVYSAELRDSQIVDSPKVLILIDSFFLESRFANLLSGDSAGLLITNSDGQTLISTGNFPQQLDGASIFSIYEAQQFSDQNGFVLAHSKAANGWHYYTFLLTDDILQEVRGATTMYFFFGIAFAIVSILFFAISYKYNFLPLRQFVRFVRQNTTDETEIHNASYSNEFEFITESYQVLIDKAEKMQQQIDKESTIERDSASNVGSSKIIVQNVHNAFKREIQDLMVRLESSLPNIESGYEIIDLDLTEKAKKYIAENFKRAGLSVEEIAENLEVSAGHLSRTFKKGTGETLLSYINAKRFNHAKLLLTNTKLPVHEIILEIGFMDVSSFHKKFKAIIGVTPGVFRSKHKTRE